MACVALVNLKLKYGPQYGLPSRVNILSQLDAAHTPRIYLVDRGDALRRYATKRANLYACYDDEDATRRAESALHSVHRDGKVGAGDDVPPPAFIWVHLRDWPQLRPGTTEAASANSSATVSEKKDDAKPTEGEDSLHPVDIMNRRVARIVNAAPPRTAVLVMAASCEGNEAQSATTRHPSAHGSFFCFAKTKCCQPLRAEGSSTQCTPS